MSDDAMGCEAERINPPDERPQTAIHVVNTPMNIWPSMRLHLNSDLRWLVENQSLIVKAAKARPMPVVRPIKAWPDGRIRIEFVGTFPSASAARKRFDIPQP